MPNSSSALRSTPASTDYPYRTGYRKGAEAFKEYIEDTESTKVTSHEAALRVARKIMVIPREIGQGGDDEVIGNFTEGFIDGFTLSWRGYIINAEDIP